MKILLPFSTLLIFIVLTSSCTHENEPQIEDDIPKLNYTINGLTQTYQGSLLTSSIEGVLVKRKTSSSIVSTGGCNNYTDDGFHYEFGAYKEGKEYLPFASNININIPVIAIGSYSMNSSGVSLITSANFGIISGSYSFWIKAGNCPQDRMNDEFILNISKYSNKKISGDFSGRTRQSNNSSWINVVGEFSNVPVLE